MVCLGLRFHDAKFSVQLKEQHRTTEMNILVLSVHGLWLPSHATILLLCYLPERGHDLSVFVEGIHNFHNLRDVLCESLKHILHILNFSSCTGHCCDCLVAFQHFSIANHDFVGPVTSKRTGCKLCETVWNERFVDMTKAVPVEDLAGKLPHLSQLSRQFECQNLLAQKGGLNLLAQERNNILWQGFASSVQVPYSLARFCIVHLVSCLWWMIWMDANLDTRNHKRFPAHPLAPPLATLL